MHRAPSPDILGEAPTHFARFFSVALVAALVGSSACRRAREVQDGEPRVLSSSPATPAPSPSASASASASGRALGLVRDLTENVGPRLSGSTGDAAAVAWSLEKMRAAGLVRVRAEPVTVPHWERGEEGAAMVSPERRTLKIAALGGSIATAATGIEADVVEAATLEALAALPRKSVEGKIAYVDVHTRRARDGSGYGDAVSARFAGPSVAARLGAVAYLTRTIGTGDDDEPHTGAMRYADDAPKIPAAAVGPQDADRLHALLSKGGAAVRVSLHLGARTLDDAQSANVVGELAGGLAAQEIVLIGAHLDSWDLGRGAQDDGAGVAIVLETMRQLAQLPTPRRTIRAVLFANEEMGVRGAKAYVAAHAGELEAHVVALEADEGAGRVWGVHWIGDPGDRMNVLRLAAPLTLLGVEDPVVGDHAGTDVSFLRASGVPQVNLMQDMSGYFDVHHSRADVIGAIDEASLNQAVRAWVSFVTALANDPTTLHRIPLADRAPPDRSKPVATKPAASASAK